MSQSGKYWNESYNPIMGCEPCSLGCRNCWALTMARRGAAQDTEYGGTCGHVIKGSALVGLPSEWNGEHYFSKKALDKPLHWKKPRVVAVNWMGDMFRTKVLNEWRVEVWRRMILASQHQYLVLTKRAENMATWLLSDGFCDWRKRWPGASDHIWHGVSACNQDEARAKLPKLVGINGKRWASLEPLLGPIDLSPWLPGDNLITTSDGRQFDPSKIDSVLSHLKGCPVPVTGGRGIKQVLNWIVVGGETGPGARPCDPAWVQSIVDQCRSAGVPCWVKQAPPPARITARIANQLKIGSFWPREKPEGMP